MPAGYPDAPVHPEAQGQELLGSSINPPPYLVGHLAHSSSFPTITTCLLSAYPSTVLPLTPASIAAVLSSGPRLPECLTGTGQNPTPGPFFSKTPISPLSLV